MVLLLFYRLCLMPLAIGLTLVILALSGVVAALSNGSALFLSILPMLLGGVFWFFIQY